MARNEIENEIGKYVMTPAGLQLLAGYQIEVLMQNSKLIAYPSSVVLICWDASGGLFHHDMVDCDAVLPGVLQAGG